jgi:hypothetical protein
MAEGTRMLQRRATEAVWNTSDYVLATGELGVTTDTGIIKVGNGTSPWSELDIAFNSEYLPLLGKAADSELLDGVSAAFFVKEADTDTDPTADSFVQRTGTGTIKGAIAVDADDLVPKGQMDTAILKLTSRSINSVQTLALTDANKIVYVDNSSLTTQIVVTIPTDASVAFPVGSVVDIVAWNTGGAKISAAVGVTLNGSSNAMPGFGYLRLIKAGSNLWHGFALREGTRLPSIKYRRTAAGDNYTGGYAFVPYDTLDATETYNPDSEWFSIPGGSMPTARRIVVNKDGEYLLNASMAVDGSGTTYCLIKQMTSDNSNTGAKVRASTSLVNVCSVWAKIRVTAGQSFGVHHGSGAGSFGRADGEDTGADPVNFKITRLSD